MNVYDGERMAELLGEKGTAPAPKGEPPRAPGKIVKATVA
jgi:hypothetical protein